MGCIRAKSEEWPIKLTVTNDFTQETTTHSTFVKMRGVLFGALNNLQDSCKGFRFDHTVDKIHGISLKSVNGVHGSDHDHTYWQLLTKTAEGVKTLHTEIGSYLPKKNEHIILRFTGGRSWEDSITCPFLCKM